MASSPPPVPTPETVPASKYKPQWGLLVECGSEQDQKELYTVLCTAYPDRRIRAVSI